MYLKYSKSKSKREVQILSYFPPWPVKFTVIHMNTTTHCDKDQSQKSAVNKTFVEDSDCFVPCFMQQSKQTPERTVMYSSDFNHVTVI